MAIFTERSADRNKFPFVCFIVAFYFNFWLEMNRLNIKLN